MLKLFRSQPRAFPMIFMLEIWERFGFYTVQGVLTLYFIRFLGFSEIESYYIFGAFSALVYGLVVVGGYLGDSILGTKRTIVLGLIILALGYLFLALATRETVYLALGLIAVGNGIFKANPSNLLAKCYEENDPRLHSAFTLYYMAINLGSTFSLFLGPFFASHYGYFYAYFLSAIGLVIGLANYFMQKQYIAHIHTPADDRPISLSLWSLILGGIVATTFFAAYLLQHVQLAQHLLWAITIFVMLLYFVYMRRESHLVFMRMLVAFILMLEAIVFFTLYQQMPTSLNLFAVNNVVPKLLGFTLDPQSFQALNPLWIIVMSPILAAVYGRFHSKGISFTVPYKFALGMLCCGVSFLSLYFARYFYNDQGMVSSWWLVLSYLLQSTGELLVSALGVAMVAELVPASISGFVMGMWFLSSAIAGFFGAYVASFTALPQNVKPGIDSLHLYTQVFAGIGIITLAIGVVMWLLAGWLNRYIATASSDTTVVEPPQQCFALGSE